MHSGAHACNPSIGELETGELLIGAHCSAILA